MDKWFIQCIAVPGGGGGGGLRIASDGDDWMGVKIKPKKIPRFSSTINPQKSLDQKLTLKKSHTELPSLNKFPERIIYIYNKREFQWQ